jgi:N-acetylglucosamine-6-sulfatase
MRNFRAITAAILLLSLLSVCPAQTGQSKPRRPNIVFILIDDLRWDELGIAGHPFLKTPNIDRIGREGAVFRNAFMTTPLCSPSRASFLTGQYAHTHGITDNIDRSAASHQLVTFPLLLQQSGYETAFIGKWHMGNDDKPRPGFDRWVSFKGQGTYHNPDINEDGKSVKPAGYITDILNGYAVQFIKQRHDKPFLVYLAHKAIHPEVTQNNDGSVNLSNAELFIPAQRHQQLYAGKRLPHRPNYRRAPTDKPALQRQIDNLPPLGAQTATRDETILGRQRSLMAIEDGVGDIRRVLQESGQLDNTIIVFTSDNGYFYGEHGLSVERRLAYEESIRMPLLLRYPKVIGAGTVRQEFALNIDLAPTLLQLAGATIPATMQGRSLVPLLAGHRPAWRNSFLIEYYSDTVFPRVLQMGYKAVRNGRWKYIHYLDLQGMDELYDLQSDPYELKNLIHQKGAARALYRMKQAMEGLLKETSARSKSGLAERLQAIGIGSSSPDLPGAWDEPFGTGATVLPRKNK